jgi:3-isopropylmalate/(R)-2-methylmalate dehydratase large subunit
MQHTLYDMIWSDHLVDEEPDGTCLLYVDRHIVHEVDSPQAFAGLRRAGLPVRAPEKTLLVVDHNVPTSDRTKPNPDSESAAQIAYFAENAKLFGLEYYNEFDKRQGICHVVGPEQGFTLPGTMLVCGDSHTATHGAFGALAYGIGTSEVEHVLTTQTLIQRKSKNMRAVVDGKLPPNVTAKDIILAIIGEIGTAGGVGYALEFSGEAIRALSMEGRMTVCNMSVEAGARTGIIAPDEKTYDFLKDRPKSPKGKTWDEAMRYWETLRSDEAARFDREVRLNASELPPLVTWGTSPEQVTSITGRVPKSAEIANEGKRPRSRAFANIHGAKGRREDRRHYDRPRVHWLLHQCAHRGSARGCARGERQDGQFQCLCDDRPWLRPRLGWAFLRTTLQDVSRGQTVAFPSWQQDTGIAVNAHVFFSGGPSESLLVPRSDIMPHPHVGRTMLTETPSRSTARLQQ